MSDSVRAALDLMGCTARGCVIETYFDIDRLATAVRHNGETASFDIQARPDYDHMVGGFGKNMQWRPLVPKTIAMWVEKRHEAERQAAIDTDPWLQYADAMLLGRSKAA